MQELAVCVVINEYIAMIETGNACKDFGVRSIDRNEERTAPAGFQVPRNGRIRWRNYVNSALTKISNEDIVVAIERETGRLVDVNAQRSRRATSKSAFELLDVPVEAARTIVVHEDVAFRVGRYAPRRENRTRMQRIVAALREFTDFAVAVRICKVGFEDIALPIYADQTRRIHPVGIGKGGCRRAGCILGDISARGVRDVEIARFI